MSTPYEAKEYYQDDAVVAAYDQVRFRGLRGAVVDRLERRLLMKAMAGVRSEGRVLDLPVGTGRMARRLTAAGHRVVGADISAPMLRLALELARRAGEAGDLVRGDGEALPFADDSFDVAVCFRLMPHLPAGARIRLLREMARVATDRVIAVYQPHRIAAWWVLYGLLLRRPVPRHFVSPNELRREFAACGLRVARSHALLRGVFMERAYVLTPQGAE